MPAACRHLILKVYTVSYACIALKDRKTVHNGLVGVCRLHYIVVPTQVEKMCTKLANLNPCAVPFLSSAAVNLSWYDSTPNLRTSYLSFEDRRCDWFTLQKNTQPGCPRSAISSSITQSVLKMVYRNPTMSVRDLSCSLSALFSF